ncbi:type II secretion system protein [Rubellicoccus peritrichatus]|uniref:Type II secretion system protein n=1 Tax=Rubellicoccus peritrichatus TaxID=3080537 RepID=A0AAQ3LAG3_9BACT|nr:type II secretion system protein [Puniceicoccus sp. CR14]WOO42081.1 type II secretion system protein [Puniceicoccus sp. CR14]
MKTVIPFGHLGRDPCSESPKKSVGFLPFSNLNHTRSAFTLVEMMILVVIIGLLAVLAMPALEKAREGSYKSRLTNDFRQFKGAFETYALDTGEWPADGGPGTLPVVMDGYVAADKFEDPTIMDGQWDWDGPGAFGFEAGITVVGSNADTEFLRRLDATLDDGNLGTGVFQQGVASGGSYTLILED